MHNAEATELMGQYCDGNSDAFRRLYQHCAPRLLNYLVRMCRERALAEDMLQLTFLKIHRARGAYVRGADPIPWMYSIAHRTFLDEMRKRQRSKVRLSAEGDDMPEIAADLLGNVADQVEESGADPELTKAALAALERLPVKQREAVVLTKLNGKSIAEAAEITGTTPGAMKVRAHRAYEALRKALSPQGAS